MGLEQSELNDTNRLDERSDVVLIRLQKFDALLGPCNMSSSIDKC